MIAGTSQVHLLYLLFLALNFLLQILNLLCNFLDKIFHDYIFLVKLDEDVEKVFVVSFSIVISDFVLDLLKSSSDLYLFF